MKQSTAEIVCEYGPFLGAERVHGVTYDGQNVWFASGDKLNAFDPASGKQCARSMPPPMQELHSMVSTFFRSQRIASRRSIPKRPGARYHPAPGGGVTPGCVG